MSSTSAVAVLAQGLRELRDFAEGPDGEELQQQTGLTSDQIGTALGGQELPTREVTLSLVQAWEGDVEAWHEYWGQIAELAEQDHDADATKKTVAPTPPEPSIITPIAEVEPEPAAQAQGEPEGGSGEAAAVEAAEPGAEPEPEQSAQAVTDAAERSETERGEAEQAQVEQAEPEQTEVALVEAARPEAEHEAARADGESGVVDAAEAGSGVVDGVAASKARETVVAESAGAVGVAAEKSIPAQRSAESAEQAVRGTQPSAVVEGVVVAGGAARPAKKGMGARVGVPVLLFAVGVGVGAFGDHALNSKQSSKDSAASVPPVSASSKSSQASHSAASSASTAAAAATGPSATPSSGGSGGSASATDSAGASGAGTGSSASTSSTVAPGTLLGNYVNIQLAAGYSVNFLSDPYHPVSGTEHGSDSMGFFADSFVDGRFYARRAAVLNSTDTGSYTSCLNDTRYQSDVLLSQVSAGGSFCITTDTGHVVLVSVKRMPSSTDANPYAVLDLTVWQGN